MCVCTMHACIMSMYAPWQEEVRKHTEMRQARVDELKKQVEAAHPSRSPPLSPYPSPPLSQPTPLKDHPSTYHSPPLSPFITADPPSITAHPSPSTIPPLSLLSFQSSGCAIITF